MLYSPAGGGPRCPIVIGVDLGGTKVAAARVDSAGAVRGPLVTLPSTAADGPHAVVDLIAEAVAKASRGLQIDAVGVGAAGIIDVSSGTVLESTDVFPDWAGVNLSQLLAEQVRTQHIAVDNDVNAHLIGEAWRGAARDVPSAFLLAVGTGVGGAVMTAGRVWRGARGVAGEVGHMPVEGCEEFRCSCGALGHLEGLGAGPGLHRYYKSLGGQAADAQEVIAHAVTGDRDAIKAVEASSSAIGRALAGVATLLDPDVVIITGGLASAGSKWWNPMLAEYRSRVITPLQNVQLKRSALGQTGAVVGAGRLAWDLLADTAR